MVNYLKEIQPGPRLAIFILSSQMRIVEGFTANPALLLAALNHKNWSGGPQSSALLRTEAENDADQQLLNNMAAAQASADAIAAMRDFQNEVESFGTYSRVQATLNALQQLARYLSGFPGRKNVIWFSGSFPLSVLPTKGQDYDFNFSEEYKKQLRETTNMLAAAQVAIYPIASEGLDGDSYTNASQIAPLGSGQSLPVPGQTQTIPSGQDVNNALVEEHSDRNASQATMDEIAQDTGGEAFYNTNGLKEALAQVISSGAHYYTISYTSNDKQLDGGFRPIKIKLRKGHYKLAYRRGYFAENAKPKKDQPPTSGDPLQPLMARGAPDSSQIIFKLRVLSADHQPDAQASIAGDNPKLKGPVTRYAVDFAVSTKDLRFDAMPDGMHKGNLEVTLVAYDHEGNTLNWLVRNTNMSLKPELYAAFQQGGVQLHQEIDVPTGDIYLRAGIYDLATNKAGTLEIPLQSAVPAVTATK
jgi:VWFA-related protein